MKRIITEYKVNTGKLPASLHFVVVSDLHNDPWEDILPCLENADALLIPGDLANRYQNCYDNSLLFLKEAVWRLPVFLSMGNHDLSQPDFPQYHRALIETGATVLCEDWVLFKGVAIAGRYLPKQSEKLYFYIKKSPKRIKQFEALSVPKILLSHRPEDYARLGKDHPIDLTISGHAHGGQIRLFGQGIFSPGQGLFPKLTHGMELPGLLVTSGAGNPVRLPRWGNPCEIVLLTFS